MKKHLFKKVSLSIFFSFLVFLILISTTLITAVTGYLVISSGVFNEFFHPNPFLFLLMVLFASVVVGTIISVVTGPSFLKPIRKIIEATNKLADGDFSVRLDINRPPELHVLSESFNRMAIELGGIEVLRTDFINNFSHEFKTPIMSIKGFAEILKKDDLTPKERDEYLDIVIDESSRLAVLATNVLNLSKIETQAILAETQVFNLGEQIRQCILLLDSKIKKKNIKLVANITDLSLTGSKELLSQVWLNLIDNAIKFTQENGTIDISMKQTQKDAIITFSDDGCGIDDEALSRIFDKFYQADVSHSVSGNGLGLTVAKRIIGLHGGGITCDSIVGRGTAFTVRLPI